MWDALPGLVEDAAASKGVRVLVVRSSTEAIFSAGADISEYSDHVGDVEWGVDNQQRISQGTRALREAPMPVVAAVDGPAFGAGAGLVVSCDIRLATARSTFAFTPAKLGMIYPFPDTAALVDVVGVAAARGILLSGRTLDSSEARSLGLLDEVTADSGLDDAVKRWTDLLAANSPTSMRLMKKTLALAAAGQRDDDETTHAYVREALEGGDYVEGSSAFLERRAPKYD